jgi:hypothetical protein
LPFDVLQPLNLESRDNTFRINSEPENASGYKSCKHKKKKKKKKKKEEEEAKKIYTSPPFSSY